MTTVATSSPGPTGSIAAKEQEAAISRLERAGKRAVGPYKYGGISAKMEAMLLSAIDPPV